MDNDILSRIYNVIPSGSLHMIELLKLTSIKYSADIDSAAMTCGMYPELLLNKGFIETYCKTDEHLFMLIMHELYHLILGHTKLFVRHDEIDNIAFDAVINSMLCKMFPKKCYTSFFTNINSDSDPIGSILRPIGEKTPNNVRPLLEKLYNSDQGTYYDVYKYIAKMFKTNKIDAKDGKPVFLGNHDVNNSVINPTLKELLDGIISKWPKELTITGRDLGGNVEDKIFGEYKKERKEEIKMKRLLKKAGINIGYIYNDRISMSNCLENINTFIPNYKDRSTLTKSYFYNRQLLYKKEEYINTLTKENKSNTIVYLDVSGSVDNDIKKMASLLLIPYKNKEIKLYTFSTVVNETTYKDFKQGKYKTTGGTNIECIFKHFFELNKSKRGKKILILTDGYVGRLKDSYLDMIRKERIEVYVGLFGECKKDIMEEYSKYMEEFNI